jgi:UDP-N-acetylmuramoylalanine--D-glutamate ligase
VTNVAEDHVDEYFQGSMDAYVAAKRGPTDHLGPGQSAALNIDDPIVRTWQAGIEARGANVVRTTLAARAVGDHASAAYQHNGELRLRWRGTEQGLISARDLPMVGDHNVENVLSAMGALLPLELELAPATEALRSFSAPGHRLEYVARIDGVDVYDDSKATNVHAALAGLAAFGGRPLVAIVGGVDKGLDLNQWVEALRARTRAVIVIGELRERLFRDHADRLPQASCADSLEEAVKMALDASKTGDVLVLSPACSSFDMFSSYAQRGERFQEIIKGKAG